MLSKFGGGGDKKIEKKWVLGEKLESMNYKGRLTIQVAQFMRHKECDKSHRYINPARCSLNISYIFINL